jgi:hypothetical protein
VLSGTPGAGAMAAPVSGATAAGGDSSVVAHGVQRQAPPGRHTLSFELRGGVGTGEHHASASAGERSAGASWRAQLAYAPLPFAAIYAAYGRSAFGCHGGFCAQAPVRFTGAGFDAGVLLGWRALWLQTGVLRHVLDAAWQTGADAGTRERAHSDPGFVVAGGVEIPVVAGVSLTPGVRYMRHPAAFAPAPAAPVVHLIADLGLRYRLPL